MRVYLLGFMGAGKTATGRSLAAASGRPFVDLDDLVEERAGETVREIFARHGEPWFRDLEHQALLSTTASDDVVVATGGGTPTFARNREVMENGGLTVWLNPSFATIVRRIGALGKADRPLFRREAEALELYRSRLPAYRSADLTVEVGGGETPEEVAARLALLLAAHRV